jgi:glycosyltransferase involved in cell wall biosynthesis
MNVQNRTLLLMGGELSSYTFDLFDTIASLGQMEVRYLYSPLDCLPSFQHEHTEGRALNRLLWKDAGWSEIKNFVTEPRPDAVFVYGNRPRVKLNLALAQIPLSTSVWYAADTNIVELSQSPTKTLLRNLACTPIARRAKAALSLGFTNRLALQAMGFHRIIELPVYAIDFVALDAAASEVEPKAARASREEIVVLIIARLTAVKNLPAFIDTFAAETDLSKNIRLVIAGEGPKRADLQTIQQRAPNLRLELLGPVPRHNIGALFAQADALLLPSLSEPWGIVVVEALGMGLPVIATPAVGAAVSLAGYTGAVMLSEDCAPKSVVAALHRFVSQREKLVALAQDGKQFIRKRYDRVEVAKAMLRLIKGESIG